jgi:hypothetical protein
MDVSELREMQEWLSAIDETANAVLGKLQLIETALDSVRVKSEELPDITTLDEVTHYVWDLAGAYQSAARYAKRANRGS